MGSIRTNPHLDGRKVGVIVPSVNTTTEPEFGWIAPPGISFHAARIFMNVTSPDALRAMNAEVRHAARQLATLSPDLVAYVCTAGSFVDGVDGARALLDDLRSVVDCPIVATSVIMVEALRHLGIARLGLATPYPQEVTEAERRFLMSSGFDVVSCACLGRSGPEVRPTTFEEIFALVQSVDRPDAQAIFISCTDLRATEMVDQLEREFRKPMLTSNQVTLWGILRALGTAVPVEGFGQLFTGPQGQTSDPAAPRAIVLRPSVASS
jgi:maleate isomerase